MRMSRGAPTKRRGGSGHLQSGLLPLGLAVAGLLALTGGYLWLLGGPTPRPPAVGGPFALTATDGRAVTERSFDGRVLLIYFGYTACQDICPTTLDAVGQAMEALGPRADRIQPLFITVDPGHDTPEVLGRYVAGFTPRLVGLTGTPGQIRTVQRAYRVTSIAHPAGSETGKYGVDHSSVLYLVGPDGRTLAPIRADESGAEMAADIVRLLS